MAVSNQFKRVVEMTSDRTVRQMPFVVDAEGKQFDYPMTGANQAIPLEQARGCVCKNHNKMAYSNLPQAVMVAENVYGTPQTARAETPAVNTNLIVWQISLNNTAGAAAEFMIFDGFGLCASKLGLSAIPGTVTVGGTFGTSTAANFKTITQSKTVRLHQLWMQSATTGGVANEAFFNTGAIRQSYASIANNSIVDDLIPTVNQVHQDTYQTSIREWKDFRVLIDACTGFHISLPASTQVNIALYITAVEQTYDMNKVGG